MSEPSRSSIDEVDQLLLNAQLRNELEPFADEAILCIDSQRVPTEVENQYLASMLAWERAPVLPIAQWFDSELVLPHPDTLSDDQLAELLWKTIHQLYHKRIVLDFTDHLSDRELYCLVYRDILQSYEKKLAGANHYLHWDCADRASDQEVWLRYYATEEERRSWAETGYATELPPRETPPYPRNLPHQPL
jgi:hypothetical protein